MEEGDTIPVAPPIAEPMQPDGRRLWIGNLDTKVTEYKFLKMVEKFGPLAEFDFLYQMTTNGDNKPCSVSGTPRGYAFVTYKTAESALSAKRTLDGLDIAGRRLAVKWAHLQDQSKYLSTKKAFAKPAPAVLRVKDSSGSSGAPNNSSVSDQIASVEAALKSLDDDSSVSIAPDTGHETRKPSFVTYEFIERKGSRTENFNNRKSNYHKPYQRNKRPHKR